MSAGLDLGPRRHPRRMSLTPMIDVVFLLLIFFVCASTGQIRESLLPTELSGGSIESAAAAPRERPLGEAWVRVVAPGQANGGMRIEVEGQTFSGPDRHRDLSRFLRTLAATARELPVILDIEPDVPLGEALAAYDAARSADFEAIHFAVDPADSSDPQPPATR